MLPKKNMKCMNCINLIVSVVFQWAPCATRVKRITMTNDPLIDDSLPDASSPDVPLPEVT